MFTPDNAPDVLTDEQMQSLSAPAPSMPETLSDQQMSDYSSGGGGVFSRLKSFEDRTYANAWFTAVPRVGLSLFKNTVKAGLGAAKSFAGELAGFAGSEHMRNKLMQPVDVAGLGTVRSFSADPTDVTKNQSATAEQTGGVALGMIPEALSFMAGAPASKSVMGAVRTGAKTGATFGTLAGASESMQQDKSFGDVAAAAGAGGLFGGAFGGLLGLAQGKLEGLPFTESKGKGLAKTASFMTGQNKDYYETAINDPARVRKMGEVIDDSNYPEEMGRDIHEKATEAYKAAQEKWQESEASILSKYSKNLQSLDSSDVGKALSKEGVKMTKDGLDFSASVFRKDPSGQKVISDVWDIINNPGTTPEAVLNSRKAMTVVLDKIPKEEKNLGRVARGLTDSFDAALGKATEGALPEMRAAYAQSVASLRSIMSKMTDDYGHIDPGKANIFVRSALRHVGGNTQRELISSLDSQVGSEFTKNLQAYGAAKALSQLDPTTRSRVFDIVRGLGVTHIPVVGAAFSPMFWGAILKGGAKEPNQMMSKAAADYLQTASIGILNWATKAEGKAFAESQ